jgi:hypothetical protein
LASMRSLRVVSETKAERDRETEKSEGRDKLSRNDEPEDIINLFDGNFISGSLTERRSDQRAVRAG